MLFLKRSFPESFRSANTIENSNEVGRVGFSQRPIPPLYCENTTKMSEIMENTLSPSVNFSENVIQVVSEGQETETGKNGMG